MVPKAVLIYASGQSDNLWLAPKTGPSLSPCLVCQWEGNAELVAIRSTRHQSVWAAY